MSGAAAHALRFLLVQAGGDLCALPLGSVRKVLPSLRVFALPQASPELLGLAEHEGEPLAVLDLARLIGAAPGPPPTSPVTVVVEAGPPSRREPVGLAADAATDIVAIPTDAIAPGDGALVRGEASLGGRHVLILDLEAIGARP